MSKLTYEQLQDIVHYELRTRCGYELDLAIFKTMVGYTPRAIGDVLIYYFLEGEIGSHVELVKELVHQYRHMNEIGYLDVQVDD